MNHFEYRDGALHAEEVPVARIAEAVGTPVYIYSTATLTRHFQVFRDAVPEGSLIAYALKANSNLAVIRTLARLGAGADVVSEGELRRALAAGVPPSRIVFSGVAKTEGEIAFALKTGIHELNIESEPELDAIARVASALGAAAPVAIRVNPDVDARTHAKISTGKGENKFGVPIDRVPALARRAASLPGIAFKGVAVHIGSQITDLGPMEAAFSKMADLVRALRADGIAVERVDLGGGLGVPYVMDEDAPPAPSAYGPIVRRIFAGLDVKLSFEPGRVLVANAGILVARTVYVKEGASRDFLILDAGMNDLVRPTLYDAHHDIVPVKKPADGAGARPYDVVGPVCETGDTFARGRMLTPVDAGELVAILSAGAYGAVQANEYNSRPMAPEVLVDGSRFAVVRARPSYEEMLGRDIVPDWLG
jgi:diaminopimelate decarboxylase